MKASESEQRILHRTALWLQRRSRQLLKRREYSGARMVQHLAAELDNKGLPAYLRGVELPENVMLFPGGEPDDPRYAPIRWVTAEEVGLPPDFHRPGA